MTEKERFMEYLKGIGCEIEIASMVTEIKQFNYWKAKEVISIDNKVITMSAFEDMAKNWCKFIEPHLKL